MLDSTQLLSWLWLTVLSWCPLIHFQWTVIRSCESLDQTSVSRLDSGCCGFNNQLPDAAFNGCSPSGPMVIDPSWMSYSLHTLEIMPIEPEIPASLLWNVLYLLGFLPSTWFADRTLWSLFTMLPYRIDAKVPLWDLKDPSLIALAVPQIIPATRGQQASQLP